MKKRNIKIIVSFLSIIAWMGFIFYLSNMDFFESNNTSKNTINQVLNTTIETTNNIGITNTKPSVEKEQQLISIINRPLRKVAHAIIYFILSILITNFLITMNKNSKKSNLILIVTIICFLYALTDEYHQSFIAGRSGQFQDCIIDTLGSLLGSSIYLFIYKRKRNVKV